MQDRIFVDIQVPTEQPTAANSFLLALQAALAASDRPTSYATLAGLTGVAFRPAAWHHDMRNEWQTLQPRLPLLGDALGLQWKLIGATPRKQSMDNYTPGPKNRSAAMLKVASPLMTTAAWDEFAGREVLSFLQLKVPTLVFGGWPGAHAHLWGVIVGWHNDIFYGHHTRSTGLELLVQPPLVAMVFPAAKKPEYSPTEATIQSFIDVASEPAWLEKSAQNVYDFWVDFLRTPGTIEDWSGHFRLAVVTRDARMAALQYISEISDRLPTEALLHLSELDLCYSQITRLLIRDIDRSYVRAAFLSADDELEEVAERVLAVKRYDFRAQDALKRLGDVLQADSQKGPF